MGSSNAAVVKKWRKENPDLFAAQKEREKARARAMRRLAAKYPGVFRRLYEEELRKL